MTEACAFCRVGSCGVHALRRIVRDRRSMPADHEMPPIGCCDKMESAVSLGLIRPDVERTGALAIASRMGAIPITWCPFCRSRV